MPSFVARYDDLLLGYIALTFVEAFLVVTVSRTKSREHWMPFGQIAFRKPLGLRSAAALFSFTVATWPLLIVGDASTRHAIISSQTWELFTISMVASFAVILVCVRASGPNDVVMSPEIRTYRRLTGWLVFPNVRSGTWDDIAGIYVWSNGSSSQVYLVYIAWVGQLGKAPIGHFGRFSRATRFADEVSKRLDIKRIDPPQ